MKILVVYGGISSEREVSLRSGGAVISALRTAGYMVETFDPQSDPTLGMLASAAASCDVVFPVLHGSGGEDGAVQSVLERAGALFVGTDSVASADCFDKLKTLSALKSAGVPVPSTELVDHASLVGHPLTSRPFVVKPRDEGSSVDTFLVRDLEQLDFQKFKPAFDKRGNMLLEELIEGVELTVPILGEQPLPVIEIIPPTGGEFDYDNKYNGKTQELCPPQHVPEEVQRLAQDLALRVHRTMGCRHMSRTDIIWSKNGELKVLEINTIPGMTDQSLFPRAAKVAGIDMPDLVDRLVRMAIANRS